MLAVALPVLAQEQQQQPENQQQRQQQPARTVELDDIENNPSQYLGQRVRVAAEVDEVLGPRVFAVDEGNWLDVFKPRRLVVVPAPLAALVREGTKVTVTGTVRPFVMAEFENEFGLFGTPDATIELRDRTVLVADTVVGADGTMMLVHMGGGDPGQQQRGQQQTGQQQTGQQQTGQQQTGQQQTGQQQQEAVGTSGGDAEGPPLTDVNQLARANDTGMVGRRVNLQNARVASNMQNGGFWVSGSGNERLFVVPDKRDLQVSEGQTVSISGVVVEMPRAIRDRISGDSPTAQEERIVVFAQDVTKNR